VEAVIRFLADESCDFAVVRALRAAGYDVSAVAEIAHRADDSTVIQLALAEQRILLTEDKDFGQLVFASAYQSAGVILVRFPTQARSALPQVVLNFVGQEGSRLTGRFAVVEPGRTRIV
jgi:predicted nuclease of predicted toxin-antitoxin system